VGGSHFLRYTLETSHLPTALPRRLPPLRRGNDPFALGWRRSFFSSEKRFSDRVRAASLFRFPPFPPRLPIQVLPFRSIRAAFSTRVMAVLPGKNTVFSLFSSSGKINGVYFRSNREFSLRPSSVARLPSLWQPRIQFLSCTKPFPGSGSSPFLPYGKPPPPTTSLQEALEVFYFCLGRIPLPQRTGLFFFLLRSAFFIFFFGTCTRDFKSLRFSTEGAVFLVSETRLPSGTTFFVPQNGAKPCGRFFLCK